MKKETKNEKDLVIFQGKDGAIELRADIKKETIWATQAEIARVFGVERSVITKHVRNIYKESELEEKATCAKIAQVRNEGGREISRNILHYNLDTIISVGYRVNSKTATIFRKWATKTLKQHIVDGYTVNKKVLAKNYGKFAKAISDVQKLLPANNAVSADDVLELIKSFSNSWFSIESYDEDTFPKTGATKKKVKIQVNDLYDAVGVLKKELIKKKQATELFAQEKKLKSLEGILGNVLQAVFGEDAYKSVEEKAAHLLYFIIKNHPFNDGNKRTGAFAFVWFLQKAGAKFRYKITPETLTAVTLLVAESNPKDKDRMVGIILLLLGK